jgi:6-phosphofructokinase
MSSRGTIAILTGGGDVPGLNPAIRAITKRALREGFRVLGIRRGWAGLLGSDQAKPAKGNDRVHILDEGEVDRIGRTGGTFLHTSRTCPSRLPPAEVPLQARDRYHDELNDLTSIVLANLERLGVDYLIPIGGDDTLSYAYRLHQEGVKVVCLPKTMDNDVPGTDYCIGFSTCVTRTIELSNQLRTTAGSHERIMIIEVFGRYAGFTALLPTLAGAADRCVIPELPFDADLLTELLVNDRIKNPSNYSVALVSEGATMIEDDEMTFASREMDQYGHYKLGGVGDRISAEVKSRSAKFNHGRKVDILNQRLGYLVRSGAPDALDSVVPMVFGNIALDKILAKESGILVALRQGHYSTVPIEMVVGSKKVVDVEKYYNGPRLRPRYVDFLGLPQFVLTSGG